MSFNPSAPNASGLEWLVRSEIPVALDATSKTYGFVVPSAAVESIEALYLFLMNLEVVDVGPMWQVDVYELDDAVATGAGTSFYRPSADVTATNVQNQAGGTTNLYQAIDEATLSTADYIRRVVTGSCEYSCNFGIVAGALTGKRITKCVVGYAVSHNDAPTAKLPYMIVDGVRFDGSTITPRQYPAYELRERAGGTSGFTNPSTRRPWNPVDVEAFASANEAGIVSAKNTIRVLQMYMRVDYVTENRVAQGGVGISDALAVDAWLPVVLENMTGTPASWSKLSGISYLVVMHATDVSGRGTIIGLDSGKTSPPGFASTRPVISGPAGAITEVGDELTDAAGILLVTNYGLTTLSADSQPYAKLQLVDVEAGRTVEAEFTPAADTYGFARAVLAAQTTTIATQDLTVNLRRRSDKALLSSVTVNVGDLAEPATDPQDVALPFDPGVLLTAVQHYVEFVCTAETGQGWRVGVLDVESDLSNVPLTAAQAFTYGGTTQRTTVAAVESSDLDAATVVFVQPDAPGGFQVETV